MRTFSAGLLMYRVHEGKLQVLLAHPGGPFFKNKDAGAWTIPKGEIQLDEDPFLAACREFKEETGLDATGPFHPLREVKLKSGKLISAWAFMGDCDPARIQSNMFTLEWPPKSGRHVEFPEIDRAGFFDTAEARIRMNAGQVPLVEELERIVDRLKQTEGT